MTSSNTTADVIAQAADVLRGRRIAIATGAGVSTDSGIPDYRGKGAPTRRPMTIATFTGTRSAQQRYWIGSHLGWRSFSSTVPNVGHDAIAGMETDGTATGVITQNVDGLHLRAGSRRVVELHGTMRRVLCVRCGQVFDRRDVAARVEAANPWLEATTEVELGPDGDVVPGAYDHFVLPVCTSCGGALRPDVVFFGEYIPVERFREAESILTASDALLIAGSSLVVNSGVRLVERARRRNLPIVIINRGETRADARATVKIDGGASEALVAIRDALR